MNLTPIAGTAAAAVLEDMGLRPLVGDALRYQPSPPAVVAPLVDELGIPRGAQVMEINGPRGRERLTFRLIGARPGLTIKIRPWKSGPLVIARGIIEGLAYASLRPDVAVWAALKNEDRSALVIPEGVTQVILPTVVADDERRRRDMAEGQALASLGFEAKMEAALAESWLVAARSATGRRKALERWEAEKVSPQSQTYYPDGTVWTYRHGLTRWRRD